MIPQTMHLFWHNGPISYLRYLTFLTARHHHPTWRMILHISKSFTPTKWDYEQQDFNTQIEDNLYDEVVKIVDEVRVYNNHNDKAPNFQSDFFRWDVLYNEGGFYLDTDQIILKPFDDLLNFQFIYSQYGDYAPVGVLGAEPHLGFIQKINDYIGQCYDPNDYNSIGPYMFIKALSLFSDQLRNINSKNMGTSFYPAAYSSEVEKIYNGSLVINDSHYALHWFGGHPLSQQFNKQYRKGYAGNDVISKILSHSVGRSQL